MCIYFALLSINTTLCKQDHGLQQIPGSIRASVTISNPAAEIKCGLSRGGKQTRTELLRALEREQTHFLFSKVFESRTAVIKNHFTLFQEKKKASLNIMLIFLYQSKSKSFFRAGLGKKALGFSEVRRREPGVFRRAICA